MDRYYLAQWVLAFEVTYAVLDDLDDALGYQRAVRGRVCGTALPVHQRVLQVNSGHDNEDDVSLGDYVVMHPSEFGPIVRAYTKTIFNILFSSRPLKALVSLEPEQWEI